MDEKIVTTMDAGHVSLLKDILGLLRYCVDGEFHDYKNKVSATPKIFLMLKLTDMQERIKLGAYDNKADAEDEVDLKKAAMEGGFTEAQCKELFGL